MRGRLKNLDVTRTQKPGFHPDGGGLYLQVTATGARSWVYRFMLRGRARAMGLGSARDFSLAEARAAATEARKLRAQGIDPIEARKHRRAAQAFEAAKSTTFQDAAMRFYAAHQASWRSDKHREQWSNSMRRYAYPVIGPVSVQAIDVELVLKVLEPIWETTPETASRVRGRIEGVLDWAKARGLRTGENPARWRGHLDHLLPARSKVRKVRHFPSLPYAEIHAFMTALREQPGISARALELLILTAARTGEVIGAEGGEFDLATKVWTVPAERMKGGADHRKPLSDRAVAIVRELLAAHAGRYLFPGDRHAKHISSVAMLSVLRQMGRADVTTHGFRSTFKTWATETTHHRTEVVEIALAHVAGDKVEAAYQRGELMEKRRALMADWARYCDAPPAAGKVVRLRS
jgi:integrase